MRLCIGVREAWLLVSKTCKRGEDVRKQKKQLVKALMHILTLLKRLDESLKQPVLVIYERK